MSLNPVPSTADPIVDQQGRLTRVWQAFFSSVHDWLGPIGGHAVTANRPINTPQNFLYIGYMFFDDTLGIPIFVKSLNPTVWISAAGAVV